MDTFVDSSWYFLRYLDPHNDEAAWDAEAPTTGCRSTSTSAASSTRSCTCMYARFFTKALADMGYLGVQEPFASLFTQGMITMDGAKMSKSKGNTVSPRDYVERFGADTAARLRLLPRAADQGRRLGRRGRRTASPFPRPALASREEVAERTERRPTVGEPSGDARELVCQGTLGDRQGHNDIERRLPVPHRDRRRDGARQRRLPAEGRLSASGRAAALRFATATAASLIFPFAPQSAARSTRRSRAARVWEDPWPKADQAFLTSDTFPLVIQVNGKRRDQVEVAGWRRGRRSCWPRARASEAVQRHIDGKQVVKEVVVPGKLVNIVVR